MQVSSIILLSLVIWWIAFSICCASDKVRRPKPTTRAPQDQPASSPEVERSSQPRWPSWSEFRAQPHLFLVVIGAGLIYGAFLVLIWPAFVIHRIWPGTRDDDVA